MSFRQEDDEDSSKTNSGRGLGLAASVIGVGIGVGAALYYYFNQRDPEAGPSTQWSETPVLNNSKSPATKREAFRERSWTLEQCSICFDMILKDHEVMTLNCTHRFHTTCILPWLEKQQTCPNCRKRI